MIQTIKDLVSAKADTTVALAREIWGYAELSYEETKSAAALIAALKQEGFTIEVGIADIPTAFTATYQCGSGKPVVGFLAEYDALSGLSQKAGRPVQEPVREGGAGHGCGHNLLGAGCYAAAVALKDYLIKEKKDGTVIFFGCPAEEGAGSKQFIARAGYFDNVDFAYTWHPETVNEVGSRGSVAIMGANFTFDGIAAHAGGEPHLGRSALDAVELMNVGCNYLREHMIDAARIHYAYSDPGGTAPNVVQSHAVIKYEVRAPKVSQVQELFTRVVDVARGAALMTGTKMKYEITMAFSDYVPNRTLGAVVDQCMREMGAPEWTEDEYQLAAEFLRTYPRKDAEGKDGTVEFKNINSGDLGLETEEEKKAAEDATAENKPLFDAMKDALNGKVKEVKVSTRLKDHPVCLSAEGPLSIEMEKVLSKQPGSEDVKSDKVLELNVNHPVFAVLKAAQEAGDADKVSKYSALLYAQAQLIEGLPVDDPAAYAEAVCSLMK